MADLRMYTDGSNFVIAETPEQATDHYLSHIGMSREDFDDDEPIPDWQELDGGRRIAFWSYRDGSGIAPIDADGAEPVTRTVANWIARLGSCYVASEDY